MSEQIASIPLEQVAAVFAGEQEGFALEEVLDVEGIDAAIWEDARADALLRVATDPEEHARYAEALQESQDRLHCDVKPVFSDVAAWVAFVHLTEKQPFAALAAKHALVPNDLCRLERHWRERLDSDRALSHRARLLREDPPDLPPLVVGERTLVPSPYAPQPANDDTNDADEPVPAEAGDGYDELNRMATLYAVLQSNVSLQEAHPDFDFANLDEAKEAIRVWDLQVKQSPQLRIDFRALVAHYRQRRQILFSAEPNVVRSVPSAPVALGAPPPVPRPEPVQSVDETAFLDSQFLPLEALPFADASVVPDTLDTTAFLTAIVFDGPVNPFEEPEGEEDQHLDVDGTSAVNPILRFSAPTPFDDVDEVGIGLAVVNSDVTASAEADSDIDGTGLVEAIRFETLPFGAGHGGADEHAVGGLTLE